MTRPRFLIGIDEAGRGPLAGPVAVGMVCIRQNLQRSVFKELGEVRNSKELSPRQREEWYTWLKQESGSGMINFSVAIVGHQIVDRQGIVWAVRLGIRRCLRRLRLPSGECLVLLDGALKAPPEYQWQKTIIGGDEKEPLIALASIAAKVRRDRRMRRFDRRFPQYGFAEHKGYGTLRHYAALEQYGPSPVHRLSFLAGSAILPH